MSAHQMRMALPGRVVARRLGINRNHHARVWCSCMDDPIHPPGNWSINSKREVLNQPRRLGAYDHLGVVDIRTPGSAVALHREHLASVA
jgi:hypothetical protein